MRALIVTTLVIAALGLSACGKRGNLIPPDGSSYPQPYPKT